MSKQKQISNEPAVDVLPDARDGGQLSPLIKSEVSFDEKTGDHIRRDTYSIAPGVDHVQEVIELTDLEKISTSQM